MAKKREPQSPVQTAERREHLPTEVREPREAEVVQPLTDFFEDPDSIVLRLDMPGVREQDLNITADRNLLAIHGEVDPTTLTVEGHGIVFAEFQAADYHRTFRLPEGIDPKGIEATLSNGVLEVRIPRTEESRVHRIQVKTE